MAPDRIRSSQESQEMEEIERYNERNTFNIDHGCSP